MIEAIPTGLISWDYDLVSGGVVLGSLEVGWFYERGRFATDAGACEIYRDGFLGPWVLEDHGAVLARATKRDPFTRVFHVETDARRLELRGVILSSSLELHDGDRLAGRIERQGWLTYRADVDLPDDLPLPVRAFLFFLAVVTWKRAAGAAAS